MPAFFYLPGALCGRRPFLLIIMSIAVSAVIRPSPCLRATLAVYAAANLAVGIHLLSGAAASFRFPGVIAVFCLLAAGAAAYALAGTGNMRRIDISGVGEMRLTVQRNVGKTVTQNTRVWLLSGSTFWPRLLMLVLRDEEGSIAVVAVLADSVSAEQFRALAVAIRAMGGQPMQDQDFFGPHKIL